MQPHRGLRGRAELTASLPGLYFRVHENGAVVFCLDPETRRGRIEMQQIAVVNVPRGEIRRQVDRLTRKAGRGLRAHLTD